jgi:signal transduction histidine kinase
MDHFLPQLSFAFDILITCLLAATIFFAVKLSRHLDSFRSNRSNMESLIRELSNQITRAQEGISVLDELSSNRGDELRRSITKAQGLSDELQLMTESANSLAERLENMAVRNRAIIDEMDDKALGLVYPAAKQTNFSQPVAPLTAVKTPKYEETLTKAKAEKVAEAFFAIRDPDFEAEEDETNNSASDDRFLSQAERDLAEALKRRTPQGKK